MARMTASKGENQYRPGHLRSIVELRFDLGYADQIVLITLI